MTDPTLSPHKPPVIEDDRELIDRLMHQIVVREDDLYAALAANERLKELLIIARDYIACDVRNREYPWAVEIFDKINAALSAGNREG